MLNHVVLSDPEHVDARALLADTLEQMGYQAESAPWRNFYLCGALELREGLPEGAAFTASEGIAQGMPVVHLFELMAVRLLPDQAATDVHINIDLTDEQPWQMSIEHSVLNAYPDRQHPSPDVTLRATALDFKRLMLGLADVQKLVADGGLVIEGDVAALATLPAKFAKFSRRFPIVTPRPAPGS